MLVDREATSINVDPELWKEAKIDAIKRGITVTELLEIALRKELGKRIPSKRQGGKVSGGKQ